ncbi:MAG: hypothetical protein BJ554DRAFT_7323 [Olpidium bornovanus]|uniref:Uncharacterized protein n=1 Tax=Olpidium bornovanus TaxID=278681 RepID=A0A8H7ZWB4_9FUNG|nr:MAG: hypothetical protein BJ554DRAFT_7323 [Olpidium bornovanus]
MLGKTKHWKNRRVLKASDTTIPKEEFIAQNLPEDAVDAIYNKQRKRKVEEQEYEIVETVPVEESDGVPDGVEVDTKLLNSLTSENEILEKYNMTISVASPKQNMKYLFPRCTLFYVANMSVSNVHIVIKKLTKYNTT